MARSLISIFGDHPLQHLGGVVPTSFEEVVCVACMKSCAFLRAYQLHPQPVRVGGEEGGGGVCVDVTGKGEGEEDTKEAEPSHGKPAAAIAKTTSGTGHSNKGLDESKGVMDGEQEAQVSDKQTSETGTCELRRRKATTGDLGGAEGSSGGAGFFGDNWRTKLCRCADCKVPTHLSFHVS